MMTAQVSEDVKNIQKLLAEKAYQAVYDQYTPVLQDMLFVQDLEEWLEFIQQEGELEEEPLGLHLSAWRGECLPLGGYQGDASQMVLDYLKDKIPVELWEKLRALPPIVLDMDESDGTLEKQIVPYEERLESAGFALCIEFDDTYCAGVYFLSVETK